MLNTKYHKDAYVILIDSNINSTKSEFVGYFRFKNLFDNKLFFHN